MAYEGAAIWLFRRLRAVDALELLPSNLSDNLRRQAFEAASLRLEVEAEVATVVPILERAGVPVILIKGIARCALADRYPYLDARATQDVDLLVPAEQIAGAASALRAEGYHPAVPEKPAGSPHHYHLPPLHRDRITVELHESTSFRLPAEVAWQRANNGSDLHRWGGMTVRLPSATELAWSAVAHAMRDGMTGFRLKRYLEVAALVNSGAVIDWTVFAARSASDDLFEQSASTTYQHAVVDRWLDAALTLVATEGRPIRRSVPSLDLEELLAWRLAVLRHQPKLGQRSAGRLLEEGIRRLTGRPMEESPPGASALGRIRRPIAGRLSRVAFSAWRATRRKRAHP